MAQGISIGELSRRTGVSASTLRYYESLGILQAPLRQGGKRRYGPRSVEQVEAVKTAKQLGFSLPEIRTLVAGLSGAHGSITGWRPMAQRKIEELEQRIEAAQKMKHYLERSVDCDARTADECGCPAYSVLALGLRRR
ncbi:MerR family transcriptional regulator [Ectothiorhodospiraceae bacterium WFHF3C12]|nr:MerR family transcriptional regulator [Ectothiorhodospiraceae bacterium WFHF3C12]